MSHQESHGGIIVDEGDEHPSHLNIEGQNAQHTTAAGEALSGESSHSETDEKKGGGKPVMEKYAYHSESILSSVDQLLLSFSSYLSGYKRWRKRYVGIGANLQYSHPKWLV
jgi:hypothetical protein